MAGGAESVLGGHFFGFVGDRDIDLCLDPPPAASGALAGSQSRANMYTGQNNR